LACLAIVPWLAGCASGGSEDDEVLATIDGEAVAMSDLDELIGDQLSSMDVQYRKQRQQLLEAGLDRVIRDRLLEDEAAQRGISLDELMASEGDAAEVTDEQIQVWYQQNQSALGGRSLEELYPRVKEFLEQNQRQAALNDLATQLREGREVDILLEPLRFELANEGSPALGPSDAPVTLTEFSDFECPYCSRFFLTLKHLKENYGDQLRVVYRQFPIDTHPAAYGAAVASLCANEQGAFWEIHDLMFREQDQLDIDSLKEKADRLGLDRASFDACLASDRFQDQIQADMREATSLGVDGTPAIFVNGIPLPGGAVPYQTVVELIDEELRRGGAL
jgi:predicted DsbA family dithiol-disulfide isomerase